jgi:predicted protein tyrosine phosphatase
MVPVVKRRKILCLCAGGQVRSVTLGGICKYWFGHEAIAASLEKLEPETLGMLYRWADVIVVVEEQYVELVPDEFSGKVRLVNIGPDRWGFSNHPDLVAEIMKHDLAEILGIPDTVWEQKKTIKVEAWERWRQKYPPGQPIVSDGSIQKS